MARYVVSKIQPSLYTFSRFHETEEEAEIEASRRSKKEGQRFLILKVVSEVGPIKPQVEIVKEEE